MRDRVRKNVVLAPLTTMGVGGPAARFVDVDETSVLPDVLEWARAQGLSTLVLGDGSNMLVGDDGFHGLVIRMNTQRLVFRPDGSALHVWADAGVSWDRLVDEAVSRNAAGIECLTGIPGRVGAAPIQNIGAYGQELSETVVAVEAVERATGRTVEFTKRACDFGYRASRFKRERDQWIVTRVHLALAQGGAPAQRYPELARRSEAEVRTPTLRSVRATVRSIRAEKSMLRVAGDENYNSAGSFFVNPVVSAAEAERVASVAAAVAPGVDMPRYPAGEGRVKLSAAWLIERSGFGKGWGDGPAGLSTRHTLALVNRGGASAAQLLEAACAVRDGVHRTFGVALVPEPVMVGVQWPPPFR